MLNWTDTQRQRLAELGAVNDELETVFSSAGERNGAFQALEKSLADRGRRKLLSYREMAGAPRLRILESNVAERLSLEGFSRVDTPLFLSRGLLEKMTITEQHRLSRQVFWVDQRRCLRPMLAPNLYYLLKDLVRVWPHPVSIFEIGPCFRRDSAGSAHLQEFTMLNLVEMGLPMEGRLKRLEALAALVMEAAGLEGYTYSREKSEVYGETVDVELNGIELGSGAIGPHFLDQRWGIDLPWVGLGFGLERIVMLQEGYNNIQKAGRSLAYLAGVRLNI